MFKKYLEYFLNTSKLQNSRFLQQNLGLYWPKYVSRVYFNGGRAAFTGMNLKFVLIVFMILRVFLIVSQG